MRIEVDPPKAGEAEIFDPVLPNCETDKYISGTPIGISHAAGTGNKFDEWTQVPDAAGVFEKVDETSWKFTGNKDVTIIAHFKPVPSAQGAGVAQGGLRIVNLDASLY